MHSRIHSVNAAICQRLRTAKFRSFIPKTVKKSLGGRNGQRVWRGQHRQARAVVDYGKISANCGIQVNSVLKVAALHCRGLLRNPTHAGVGSTERSTTIAS
ncbi:MAG: hypothetical protein AB8B91_23585 [Rubripirellula sp.]